MKVQSPSIPAFVVSLGVIAAVVGATTADAHQHLVRRGAWLASLPVSTPASGMPALSGVEQPVSLGCTSVRRSASSLKRRLSAAIPAENTGRGASCLEESRRQLASLQIALEQSVLALPGAVRESNHPADPSGAILYQEDFNTPNSIWPTIDDSQVKTGFANGEYLIGLKVPGLLNSITVPIEVDNFGLEVQAHAGSSADPVAYGLIFGRVPGNSDRIAFVLRPSERAFALVQLPAFVYLVNWTSSASILTDVAKNSMRVERRGADVRLLVNGSPVGQLSVPHAASDQTGIVAWNPVNANLAEAYFDNLLLEELDAITPGVPGTPTATPTPPTSGPHFEDDFSNPASGWRVGDNARWKCEYLDSKYHCRIKNASDLAVILHDTRAADVDLTVDARITASGGEPWYALVFAAQNEADFFGFGVDPSAGTYFLFHQAPDGGDRFIRPTEASAIRRGDAVNRLRVVVSGSTLRMYVNGSLLATRTLVIPLGHIGLLAASGDDPDGADAWFDNVAALPAPKFVPTATLPGPTPTRTPEPTLVWPTPETGIFHITEENFDGPQFPPAGWTVVDDLAIRDGHSAGYQWGRAGCDSASGDSSAWAIGGGIAGSLLSCGAGYRQPVITSLRYGPIDTRPYPGGIRVNYRFKPSAPSGAFGTCAAQHAGPDGQCIWWNGPRYAYWTQWIEPLVLDWVGGSQDAYLFFGYSDDAPTGQSGAVLIDDVVIEGIATGDLLPTATPTAPPSITLIHAQGFDGPTFPPEGWTLVEPNRPTEVPEYLWGRRTCDAASPPSAVWSSGGGRDGAGLACGAKYPSAMITQLRYGPVDARPYPNGLQVRLKLNADLPPPGPNLDQGFLVCMDVAGQGQMQCSLPGRRSSSGAWWDFATAPFESTINQAQVEIVLIYLDTVPANWGRYTGAVIDDVAIEGVGSKVLPTPETPSPAPAVHRTFLPLVSAGAIIKPPAEPTMSSQGISIQFGAGVAPDGKLLLPGNDFAFGTSRLVARLRYIDQTPGAVLRWTWLRDGSAIDIPRADGQLPLPDGAGHIDLILVEPDGGPLRLGSYEVRIFRGTIPEPAATAAARIQRTAHVAASHPPAISMWLNLADLERLAAKAAPPVRSVESQRLERLADHAGGRRPVMVSPQ